jgi:hypothetical protein
MQNDIPVYLTLPPSHPPHLSLLPLILALTPTSPIHILRLLPPSSYTLTLDGLAPWTDIWVPYKTARELCEVLGFGRLFWDEERKGRGMLDDRVGEAVSWEEDGAVCHKSVDAVTWDRRLADGR